MLRCPGCMRAINEDHRFCPYCGYVKGTQQEDERYLKIEFVLEGRYIIGKALGIGGFGITYIAWDSMLKKTVAIKEYFPSSFVTRGRDGASVKLTDPKMAKQFENGRKKAIQESRCLARLDDVENVTDVYDCFEANNTAYIIMEYLDGMTLKQLLNDEGQLAFEKAINIIFPVINSLGKVHEQQLIHRDISPENIFLCNDGKIKILDFGSAKFAANQNEKTYTIVLKHGYAPVEQYSTRSEQGTWTDVYAVAATLYRMITGIRPIDSIERVNNDTLKSPKELGVRLPDYANEAIMNALCVDSKYRTRTMQSFKRGLSGLENRHNSYYDEMAKRNNNQQFKYPMENEHDEGVKKYGVWIALVAVLVSVAIIAAVLTEMKNRQTSAESQTTLADTTESTEITTTSPTTTEKTTEATTEESTTAGEMSIKIVTDSGNEFATVAQSENVTLILENIPEDAGKICYEVEDKGIVQVNVLGNLVNYFIKLDGMTVNLIGLKKGSTNVHFYLENYPEVSADLPVDVILSIIPDSLTQSE